MSEKSFLAIFGGEELYLYFQKNKKITQYLLYHTMTKLTSLTMKASTAAKKKSGKWDRAQYFYRIILYFVACVSFSYASASFLPFFDEQRRHNARIDRMIRQCFFDVVLI